MSFVLFDNFSKLAEDVCTMQVGSGLCALVRVEKVYELLFNSPIRSRMSGGVNVLSSSAVFFQHAITYFKAKEDKLMRERTVPPRHYEFSFPHTLHGRTVDAIGCSKVRCFRFDGNWRPSTGGSAQIHVIRQTCSYKTLIRLGQVRLVSLMNVFCARI